MNEKIVDEIIMQMRKDKPMTSEVQDAINKNPQTLVEFVEFLKDPNKKVRGNLIFSLRIAIGFFVTEKPKEAKKVIPKIIPALFSAMNSSDDSYVRLKASSCISDIITDGPKGDENLLKDYIPILIQHVDDWPEAKNVLGDLAELDMKVMKRYEKQLLEKGIKIEELEGMQKRVEKIQKVSKTTYVPMFKPEVLPIGGLELKVYVVYPTTDKQVPALLAKKEDIGKPVLVLDQGWYFSHCVIGSLDKVDVFLKMLEDLLKEAEAKPKEWIPKESDMSFGNITYNGEGITCNGEGKEPEIIIGISYRKFNVQLPADNAKDLINIIKKVKEKAETMLKETG